MPRDPFPPPDDLPIIRATDEDIARMDANLTAFQRARAEFLLSVPPRLRARLMRRWGLRPSDLDVPPLPPPSKA